MARLKDKYTNDVVPALREKLGVTNPMLVPHVTKVTVNMAFGIVEKDVQKKLVEELAAITGQHPYLCRARKSISNFKLREGMVVGAKVTLRGTYMYEFLDRLCNVTLPRIRDFRGIPNRGFDGRGNYTFGLKDQTTFPEIDVTQIPVEKGMDITICTTATNDEAARELLTMLGVPFVNRKKRS